jgi:hypothetical protein
VLLMSRPRSTWGTYTLQLFCSCLSSLLCPHPLFQQHTQAKELRAAYEQTQAALEAAQGQVKTLTGELTAVQGERQALVAQVAALQVGAGRTYFCLCTGHQLRVPPIITITYGMRLECPAGLLCRAGGT